MNIVLNLFPILSYDFSALRAHQVSLGMLICKYWTERRWVDVVMEKNMSIFVSQLTGVFFKSTYRLLCRVSSKDLEICRCFSYRGKAISFVPVTLRRHGLGEAV